MTVLTVYTGENTEPADGGCPACSQIGYSKLHDPTLVEVWTRKSGPKGLRNLAPNVAVPADARL